MKIVELYLRVRQSVFVEGRSRRETARLFGLARKTVDKMCTFSAPPGYRRRSPAVRPKLDGFTGIIDQILADDQRMPAKQKHTAKRIFERLRDEYGVTGRYTIVKSYIHDRQVSAKEMFVPLHHPAGHAQVDFGEAMGMIGGVARKLHFFCMDLPHSDAIFVKAYPAETTEAFLDGPVAAFAFFGKLPLSILYDNTRLALAAVLGDGRRRRTKAFTELQSHDLFEDRFGRPGKGNDKGKVEGLVSYARRNFMVPMPEVASYEDLNSRLAAQCLERRREVLRGPSQTIDERLAQDLTACRGLPAVPFDPCDQRPGRVSSISLVRYRGNDYSVPTRYGHREVQVKGYVDTVVISHASPVIARHRRSCEHGGFVFDPLHSLALLERKTRALDQAAPLQGWVLPAVFAELRRLREARLEKQGRREFVQVLRRLEVFPLAEVAGAIQDAIERGALGFDAIQAADPVPDRAPPGPAGPERPSRPGQGRRKDHRGQRLPGPGPREGGMAELPHLLLDHPLKTLKLPIFLREYDKVARHCAADGVDHPRYLLRLAELELMERERRTIERRSREARFPAVKSLDTFDFAVIPSRNKMLVLELSRCEYIVRRENVIALGNSGTGKSHIALALGLAACQRGFTVGFATAAGLVHQLLEARDERRLLKLQQQLQSCKLLIVDELGYVPLSSTGGEFLFETFSQRYERGSTIVTSNLPFDEWTGVFGNERLTGALLDRLTHHVHILEMNGESYRLKHSIARRQPAPRCSACTILS